MEANNIKAMREALSRILGIADHLQTRFAIQKFASEEILELKQIAESALSAPPRNCDVGTSEEKDARHSKWCRRYGIDGDMEVACAHEDMSCVLCALRWEQMPYEEGGSNGK